MMVVPYSEAVRRWLDVAYVKRWGGTGGALMLEGDAQGWFIQVAYASEGRGGSVFTVDAPNVPTAVLEELASRIRKELDERRRLVMIVREQTEREARERRP